MSGIDYIIVGLAMVSFAGWMAVRKRHATRTLLGSLFLFAVLAAYFGWMAGWSDYVILHFFPNVPLVVPIFSWLLVFGCGLFFAVRRIQREAIFRSEEYTEIKRKYVWKIRALLIASYVLLPAITFVSLQINEGNYEGEAFPGYSLLLYMDMFWFAYRTFLTFSWWPLPIFHFLFSHEIIYAPRVRKSVFIPILISLCLFFSPYAFMLWVLAFDILEMDYGVAHVQSVYLYYFLALAPAIGLPLGLASWFGIRGVAKKLERRSISE